MRKGRYRLRLALGLMVTLAGPAGALSLGTNITISDAMYADSSSWYGNHEDQEVEPRCTTGQAWDLEGFYLNDLNQLSVVTGFDLRRGNCGATAGDIFLDTTGDAEFGQENTGTGGDQSHSLTVQDTFGYDFVLDVNWFNLSYDVYALSPGDMTARVYYNQNDESNPWRYARGGDLLFQGLTFGYQTGLTNAQTGLLGDSSYRSDDEDREHHEEHSQTPRGSHNVAIFDLSFLAGCDFTSHLTLSNGNDNLMGGGAIPCNQTPPSDPETPPGGPDAPIPPIPEPASMVMVGMGLALAASKKALRRKS